MMAEYRGLENIMDIFDASKPFPKIVLPYTSYPARRYTREDPVIEPQNYVFDKPVRERGTAYVAECRQREREERHQLQNYDPDDLSQKFRTVSIEGSLPVTEATIFDDEEAVKKYFMYDVGHRTYMDLPIKKDRNYILQVIDAHPSVVISGFTGCGKSTQVPQYILDHCAEKKVHCSVVVVQPRRISATSLAKRVCDERHWDLGGMCGYQIGLEGCKSPDTRILYCTTRVFLEMLVASKDLNRYTHVVLDEVHERGQDLDMAMILVKKFQQTVSRHIKVILMSATMDSQKFSRYFAQDSDMEEFVPDVAGAPEIVINKKEKQHNLTEFYLDELRALGEVPKSSALNMDSPALLNECVALFCKLIGAFDSEYTEGDKRHSVLVFLPGIHEIDRVYQTLCSIKESIYWKVMRLHSTLPDKEQQEIFLPIDPDVRKIILATNIAESSITVPDVRYVVDFCLTKSLKTDPETSFTTLHLSWCTKNNCIQRAGRAGRVADGRVYRLVTREFYKTFAANNIPEILESPIEKVVLKSKKLDLGEPKAILSLAMDPPMLENIEAAVLTLKEVGGLLMTTKGRVKKHDGDLTFLGCLMANLPVGVRIAKLIALGHVFDCLYECIIIGAALSQKSPFTSSYSKHFEMFKKKLEWAKGSFSDCLVLFNVYELWQTEKRNNSDTTLVNPTHRTPKSSCYSGAEDWAHNNGLDPKVLCEIQLLVHELTRRLNNLGIQTPAGHGKMTWTASEKSFLIKLAVAGACYPNYFVRSAYCGQVDERRAVRSLEGRNPYNTVALKGFPKGQQGPCTCHR